MKCIEKVQTGLRIPESQYKELIALSQRIGVSINSLSLTLIDIGLSAVTLGIQEASHSLPQNLLDIS